MLAYATRLGCSHAVLVYPWTGESAPFDESPSLVVTHSGGELRIRVVGLPLLWETLDDVRSELSKAIAPIAELA
jgi:hypothetical protein